MSIAHPQRLNMKPYLTDWNFLSQTIVATLKLFYSNEDFKIVSQYVNLKSLKD